MEQRNLIMAIVLSVSILLGFQIFIEAPRLEKERAAGEAQSAGNNPSSANRHAGRCTTVGNGTRHSPDGTAQWSDSTSSGATGHCEDRPRKVLSAFPRVKISTNRVIGSIRLRGALIDDLTLLNYRQTIEKDSPNIVLLSPLNTENPYYAQFGWVSQTAGITVPDADTVWTPDRETLSVGSPVTLRWSNPEA